MGKRILVTGGGRGLGKGVALALAKAGHSVMITARNEAAGRATCEVVKALGYAMECRALELGSFDSIRAFARGLEADERFDVVLHVAGLLQQDPTRHLTADGFETTLAVNTLAPALLTHELLPRIGGATTPGRVVLVSSRLHLPDSRGTPVAYDFDDPNLERGYVPDRAYKNSKLAGLWFGYELARRIPPERVTVHFVCPGFVPETIAATSTGMMRFMMRFVLPMMPFAVRYDDAVDAIAFTAVDPLLDASTGRFWAEKKPFESSPESRDEAKARRFFEWAAEVTKTNAWPRRPS